METARPDNPDDARAVTPDWHAQTPEQVLRALDSNPQGLSAAQAAQRLAQHGPNELPAARGVPGWRRFLRQFNDPLILFLLAAALLSLVLQHLVDAGVIAAVVLVNATHPVPEDYVLDLVTLDNGFPMDKRCVEALMNMLDDCVAAGCTYKFNSGYRSLHEQNLILEERTELYMDQGYSFGEARYMALLTVAIPGTSEHHLGLAADVEGIAALEWLSQHCWEYGFILRYPEGKTDITGILFEPWHFRYVGKEVSMAMKDTGLCLEEYLSAVSE